jgi:PAS domain S-box-containing protein
LFKVPHTLQWLATSKGDCLYANPALERFAGLNSDQIKQVDWRSFLLEEDRAAATASWHRSLATGAPYRMRVRMRGFDGVPATIELMAFGHKVGDGTELWFFTGLRVDGATELVANVGVRQYAIDPEAAERLWTLSEELTRVKI